MKIFVLMIAMLVSNLSYAQDSSEPVLKDQSLYLYMDYSSGVINKNEDNLPLLNGNETEFGVDWSTSFTSVPWLRTGFKGYMLLHLDVDSTSTNVVGLGSQGVYIKDPAAAVHFTVFDYLYVEIDTLMRVKPSLRYVFNFGNQYVRLFTGVEILTVARSTATKTFDTLPQHLELFNASVTYNIKFHEYFSYRTEVQFRFTGVGGANGIGGFVEPDSMESVITSFHMRWNNSLMFHMGQYSAYVQVRYQPERLTHNIYDPIHKVSVHGGMGYSFDL